MLERGETERKGGWRKKEREARGESTFENADGKAEKKGKERRRRGGLPRGRGGLLALSLCFSKLGTPFSNVVDQRSTCPTSRINSRAILSNANYVPARETKIADRFLRRNPGNQVDQFSADFSLRERTGISRIIFIGTAAMAVTRETRFAFDVNCSSFFGARGNGREKIDFFLPPRWEGITRVANPRLTRVSGIETSYLRIIASY